MEQVVGLADIRRMRVVHQGRTVNIMEILPKKPLERPPVDNELIEVKDKATGSWGCYKVIHRRVFTLYDSHGQRAGCELEVVAVPVMDV